MAIKSLKTREGKNNPFYGKKHSVETKNRMKLKAIDRINNGNNKTLINKGEHKSPKTEFKPGNISKFKGKNHSEEIRKIMKQNHPNVSLTNNPNWRGGKSFEEYSLDWTETLKRAIRERDNYICQICSKYGDDVHHKDYDKKNCNPDNLITLCDSCHSKTNYNREYWILFFKIKALGDLIWQLKV